MDVEELREKRTDSETEMDRGRQIEGRQTGHKNEEIREIQQKTDKENDVWGGWAREVDNEQRPSQDSGRVIPAFQLPVVWNLLLVRNPEKLRASNTYPHK